MAIEIERKYLVIDDSWQPNVTHRLHIRQGYFARTPLMRARIRLIGNDQAFITLKSQPGSLMRYEYEYAIPYAEAAEMVERFSIEPLVRENPPLFALEGPDLEHRRLRWSKPRPSAC